MGARDLSGFRSAGRTLFSLGLVRASEGNLSTFDGERLLITRTGSELADLSEGDVLEGSLQAPPEGSSSDLPIHVAWYRERGPGAIAHAHPPRSVPQGWVEGQPHGRYAFASSLEEAVDRLVTEARSGS